MTSRYSVSTEQVLMKILIDDHVDIIQIPKDIFEKCMKVPEYESMPWEHVYDLSLEDFGCSRAEFVEVCNLIGDLFHKKFEIYNETVSAYINKFIDVYFAPHTVSDLYLFRYLPDELFSDVYTYMIKPYEVPQKQKYDFTGWNTKQEEIDRGSSALYKPVGDMRDAIAFIELYYTNRIHPDTLKNDWYPTIKTFLKELDLEKYIHVSTYKGGIDKNHTGEMTKNRMKIAEQNLSKGKLTMVLKTQYNMNKICYNMIVDKLQTLLMSVTLPEHVMNRLNNITKYSELLSQYGKKKSECTYSFDSDIESVYSDHDID